MTRPVRDLLPCLVVALLLSIVPTACAPPDGGEPPAADAAGEVETAAGAPTPRWTGADVVAVEGAALQIAGAAVALPADLRERAAVLGYDAAGSLVLLRAGDNGLVCLADTPGDDAFQVACYSETLEPYMARGRELRAAGVESDDNFARRHEEIDAGTLQMPREPTMVYNFGGPLDIVDPESGAIDEARGRRVYSIYTPYATAASTGLSETPMAPAAPWIMRPGTPSSHIMVVPPAPQETAEAPADRGDG